MFWIAAAAVNMESDTSVGITAVCAVLLKADRQRKQCQSLWHPGMEEPQILRLCFIYNRVAIKLTQVVQRSLRENDTVCKVSHFDH